MTQLQEEFLWAAKGYAEIGWPVFPLNGKFPLAGSHGCKDATTDIKQIETWWEENPHANIGLATGKESGVFVVDVDMKNDKDGLQTLQDHFGKEFDIDVDGTPWQKTPTGGFHFVFKWEDELSFTLASDVLKGIDLRGEGGYIVVSPSCVDGVQYRWKNEELIADGIPDAPSWVRKLVRLTKEKAGQRLDIKEVMSGLTEGQRDEKLFRYACHLRSHDIPYELAVGFVGEAAARCTPPFDPMAARKKVEDAYTKYESKKTMSMEERIKEMRKKNNG